MRCHLVSKNGNLLLNIPLPGHGKPHVDEMALIDKFGAWMALNS
jgi:alpha-L-fucosidase